MEKRRNGAIKKYSEGNFNHEIGTINNHTPIGVYIYSSTWVRFNQTINTKTKSILTKKLKLEVFDCIKDYFKPNFILDLQLPESNTRGDLQFLNIEVTLYQNELSGVSFRNDEPLQYYLMQLNEIITNVIESQDYWDCLESRKEKLSIIC